MIGPTAESTLNIIPLNYISYSTFGLFSPSQHNVKGPHYAKQSLQVVKLAMKHELFDFMFRWLCISIYACNETNLMQYLFYHCTSVCFGLASCPSSGGNNVYM
jgi:hypothetical protein